MVIVGPAPSPSIEALVDLSNAYTGQGQVDKAAGTLAQALALDPFHPAVQRFWTHPVGTNSR